MHPCADVDRLYVHRKKGDRGLMRVHDAILAEETKVEQYVSKSAESLLVASAAVLYGRTNSENSKVVLGRRRSES